VQLIVVSLENDKLRGQVSQELHRASEKGDIRLLDALAIQKQQNGSLVSLGGSDLTPDQRYAYGALLGSLIGFGATGTEEGAVAGAELGMEKFATHNFGLSNEDIQSIAASVPPGTTALMVLFEHRWALPLKAAVESAGGMIMAQGFVRPENLIAMGANLAAAEATAEQIEQEYHG
jgi:uncharacterized membrane protein